MINYKEIGEICFMVGVLGLTLYLSNGYIVDSENVGEFISSNYDA